MTRRDSQSIAIPDRRPLGPIVASGLVILLALGLAAGACLAFTAPFRTSRSAPAASSSAGLARTAGQHKPTRASSSAQCRGKSSTAARAPRSTAEVQSTRTVAPELVTRTRVTHQRLVVRGHGSIESMVQAGSPGLKRITISSVSNRIVKSVTLKRAVPTVVRRRKPTAGRIVALTFDDGPHPTQTAKVLKILQSEHIKATFFMVGKMAHYHPQAARAVAAAGMLIGDHTEDHKLLPGMTETQIRHEIAKGQASIRAVTGVTTHWFRSPYGAASAQTRRDAGLLGMKVVAWDVDPNDWKNPAAKSISSYVVGHVRPGAIVLLHDGGGSNRTHTIEALPTIIRALKKKHYRFVTLGQL